MLGPGNTTVNKSDMEGRPGSERTRGTPEGEHSRRNNKQKALRKQGVGNVGNVPATARRPVWQEHSKGGGEYQAMKRNRGGRVTAKPLGPPWPFKDLRFH